MEQNNGTKKLVYLIIFAAVFLVFVIFGLILMFGKRQALPQGRGAATRQSSSTGQAVKPKGTMTAKAKDDRTAYKLEETVTVVISADSIGRAITGYDIVLDYDPQVVSYAERKNLLADFDLFGGVKEGKLVLTGVKKLNSTAPSVFRSSPLVELTFKTIGKGKAAFSLEAVPDSKKDSNLITDANEEVLEQTESAEILVGESVQLLPSQPLRLSGTDITATLKEVSIPEENCRDCITAVTLEVAQAGQTKTLEYKRGGFAGYLMEPQETFGYTFSIENVAKEEIILVYGR